MASPVGLWEIHIPPDKDYKFRPLQDMLMSNIALSHKLLDDTRGTFISLQPPGLDLSNDEKPVLAYLILYKTEQVPLDLYLEQDSGEYVVHNHGPNTVHVMGTHYGNIRRSLSKQQFKSQDTSKKKPALLNHSLVHRRKEKTFVKEAKIEEISPKAIVSNSPLVQEAIKEVVIPDTTSQTEKAEVKKRKRNDDGPSAEGSEVTSSTVQDAPQVMKKAPIQWLQVGSTDIRYYDYIVSQGRAARPGTRVEIIYVAKVNKIPVEKVLNTPVIITLGPGNSLPAWSLGVDGMKVGGQQVVTGPAITVYTVDKLKEFPDPIDRLATVRLEIMLRNVIPA